MHPRSFFFRLFTASTTGFIVVAGPLHAASSSWNVNAAGPWATAGNWVGSAIPGSTSLDNADVATFSFTLATNGKIVTVDNPRYIGGISFGNTSAFGYTLSTGALNLNNGGVVQTLAANGAHTDTISAPIQISGTSGATAAFTANATSVTSVLSIGAVSGSSASGSTTLTLNGTNTGGNVVTGVISDGLGGGNLALTKAAAGTWVLSGANTYTGLTSVNGGILKFSKTASLYNGVSGGWTAGNIVVAAGGTVAFNVGGIGEFATGDVTTLLTNLTAGISGNGLQAGSAIGFDTTNASGGTFTVADLIADSTGTGAGSLGVSKLGTNTLVLSNTNTYTGVTTVNGGSLSVATIGNGGVAGNLGQATNAAANLVISGGTLLYTGATDSSDRNFTLATGTTSTISVATGATNLTLAGGSAATTGILTKAGAGTLTLTGSNLNTGGTNINGGTLVIGTTNPLLTTAAVTMNSAGSGTGAALDLSNFSQTTSNLIVRNTATSSANADTITIGSGKALTVNGSVTLGNATASTTTFTTISGNGALNVTTGGFQVGGATATSSGNSTTLDMSGLATFSAALASGTFRIGDSNVGSSTPTGNETSTVFLAKTSSITAGTLSLGGETAGAFTQTLKLGTVANTINATTVQMGAVASSGARGSAEISFQTSAGSLVLRGNAGGSSRVTTFNVINSANVTGTSFTGLVDLSGHSSDLMIGTLTIAKRSGSGTFGNATGTFTIDTGTLDVTTIDVANRTLTSTASGGTNTGVLNIGGGTATIGNITAATYSKSGSGALDGASNATLNFTGGTITVNGNISKGSNSAFATAALNLDGASLNMTAHNIGSVTLLDNLNFKSGTLLNVAQINNGAGLTKTTGGTLILGGTNTYTGTTTVSGGTLLVNGANNGTGAVAVSSTATLGGTGSIAGDVNINAGGFVAPGTTGTGTLSVASATLAGTYNCQLDVSTGDKVAVTGTLTISPGAAITVSTLGTPTGASYTIASYGTLSGSLPTITGIPSGYVLDTSTAGQVNLVKSGYTAWAAGFGGLTDSTPGGDPDGDGIKNLLEYVLGGDPRVSSSSIVPAQAVVGSNLVLSYKRNDDSKNDTTQIGQWSTDLSTWHDVTPFMVADNGTAPDDMTITVPTSFAVGGKLFVRLKVTQP